MLQSVIEVSLQGSDVVAGSNSIETDPGVSPLHSHVVADDPEVVLDALLGQPMLELNISRLESIYEATKSIPFDAMKVRLEIRKRVKTISAPKLLIDIFFKLNQCLSRPKRDSTDWLFPLRF